jgi:hypothetical protein
MWMVLAELVTSGWSEVILQEIDMLYFAHMRWLGLFYARTEGN